MLRTETTLVAACPSSTLKRDIGLSRLVYNARSPEDTSHFGLWEQETHREQRRCSWKTSGASGSWSYVADVSDSGRRNRWLPSQTDPTPPTAQPHWWGPTRLGSSQVSYGCKKNSIITALTAICVDMLLFKYHHVSLTSARENNNNSWLALMGFCYITKQKKTFMTARRLMFALDLCVARTQAITNFFQIIQWTAIQVRFEVHWQRRSVLNLPTCIFLFFALELELKLDNQLISNGTAVLFVMVSFVCSSMTTEISIQHFKGSFDAHAGGNEQQVFWELFWTRSGFVCFPVIITSNGSLNVHIYVCWFM